MKRRLLAVVLAAVMMVAAIVPAAAYTVKQQNTADALNELGLFLGKGAAVGYALDDHLTRAEGVTLLVRMMGKEEESKSSTYRTPFVDVPDWAAGYVGYAYTNKITNGTSDDKFGSNVQLNDYTFLTLVLRALGHTDEGENAEFTWKNPYTLAKKIGLIDVAAADGSFTRGDAVEVFWNAMSAEVVGQGITLAQSLIDQGVFTAEEFAEAERIQLLGRTGIKVEEPEEETPETNEPETDEPVNDDPAEEIPDVPVENPGNGNGGGGFWEDDNNQMPDDEL